MVGLDEAPVCTTIAVRLLLTTDAAIPAKVTLDILDPVGSRLSPSIVTVLPPDNRPLLGITSEMLPTAHS